MNLVTIISLVPALFFIKKKSANTKLWLGKFKAVKNYDIKKEYGTKLVRTNTFEKELCASWKNCTPVDGLGKRRVCGINTIK